MPAASAPQGLRIVSYLNTRIGSTIGAGECWDAAENAIKDIGQFTVTVTQDDGSWSQQTFGAPRHTAVVESINSDGSVNLLHQNYGGARNVTQLADIYLTSGSVGGATVTTSGSVTRYRPQVP
jgi:surface antigen